MSKKSRGSLGDLHRTDPFLVSAWHIHLDARKLEAYSQQRIQRQQQLETLLQQTLSDLDAKDSKHTLSSLEGRLLDIQKSLDQLSQITNQEREAFDELRERKDLLLEQITKAHPDKDPTELSAWLYEQMLKTTEGKMD